MHLNTFVTLSVRFAVPADECETVAQLDARFRAALPPNAKVDNLSLRVTNIPYVVGKGEPKGLA